MKNVIVFAVEGARFAVELRWVREVITLGHVTPVPGAPSHVAGAINVRGVITPVIDLCVLDRRAALEIHRRASEPPAGEAFAHHHSAVLLDVDGTALALAMVKVDEVVTASESPGAPGDDCAGIAREVLSDSKNNPVRLIDPPALVKHTLARAQELAARHPAGGRSPDIDHGSQP